MSGDTGAGVADITHELGRRACRPPDHEAEAEALARVARSIAGSPDAVLGELAEAAPALCRADGSGIGLAEAGPEGRGPAFRWRATAGASAPPPGGVTPGDFGPGDSGSDLDDVRLIAKPGHHAGQASEWLVAPLRRDGEVAGVIGVVACSAGKRFDSEDRRLLASLARVASAAFQASSALVDARRMSEELRSSEAQSRALLDSMDEGFCIIEVLFDASSRPVDYRYLEMNPAFVDHSGLRDATGRTVREIVADHEDHWFEVYGQVALTGESVRFANEARSMGRWFDVHASRLGGPESRKVAVLFTDITARVSAEEELKASEERVRLATEAAGLGIWVWDVAEDRVVYENDRLFEIFGQSRSDEPLNRARFLANFIHPDDVDRFERAVADTLRRGTRFYFLGRFRRGDGDLRWIELTGQLLKGAGAASPRVLGTAADVTERQHAEEATRGRARKLQHLARIANRINTAHDVNSVIGVVTEEARNLIGAGQAATIMVLNPDHPQPINVVAGPGPDAPGPASLDGDGLRFFEVASRSNGPIRLTRDGIEADPRWRALGRLAGSGATPNGWLAAPLIGRNGKNMGLIQLSDRSQGEFTADDEALLVQLAQLTAIAVENARLYQELRSNDERKDEFLAMLAHELRNPLAAIGNAVRLSSNDDAGEHLGWSLEVITRQMSHLSRLIDDLMDVSRITRGKITLRRDVVDAAPILESAAATVAPLVEERMHTLDRQIEAGTLWVDADPTRLEQVVVNLLNNAAKYSENGGKITLSARSEAGQVVIRVEDNGLGIAPEKLPEMFELFAQGDRTLARSEAGLGIGLTVVKKLVEMHGGTITAALGAASQLGNPGREGIPEDQDPGRRRQRRHRPGDGEAPEADRPPGGDGAQRPRGDREGQGGSPGIHPARHRPARHERVRGRRAAQAGRVLPGLHDRRHLGLRPGRRPAAVPAGGVRPPPDQAARPRRAARPARRRGERPGLKAGDRRKRPPVALREDGRRPALFGNSRDAQGLTMTLEAGGTTTVAAPGVVTSTAGAVVRASITLTPWTTASWSTTLVTPVVLSARSTARDLAEGERTEPWRITTPPAWTSSRKVEPASCLSQSIRLPTRLRMSRSWAVTWPRTTSVSTDDRMFLPVWSRARPALRSGPSWAWADAEIRASDRKAAERARIMIELRRERAGEPDWRPEGVNRGEVARWTCKRRADRRPREAPPPARVAPSRSLHRPDRPGYDRVRSDVRRRSGRESGRSGPARGG